jgi:hypothetical protein
MDETPFHQPPTFGDPANDRAVRYAALAVSPPEPRQPSGPLVRRGVASQLSTQRAAWAVERKAEPST